MGERSAKRGLRWAAIIIVLGMLGAVPEAGAEIRGELPLGEFCRVGRCIPVRVSARVPARIAGEGLIPTEIGGAADRVVPVLVAGLSRGTLRIAGSHEEETIGGPLRPLEDRQKLVGCATADGAVPASGMFAEGREMVQVRLDPARPLAGPALAWEALDAVVIDGPWPGGADRDTLAGLLANGMVVAVRGGGRPEGRWRWRRMGEYWIAGYQPAGPAGAIGGSEAYAAAEGWQPPAQPAPVRRQIAVAGVMVALLAMGGLLVRPAWAAVAATGALMLAAGIGIGIWRRSVPELRVAGGQVIVAGGSVVQRDRWDYLAAAGQATEGSIRVEGGARPIVVDAEHAHRVGLHLRLEVDGRLEWRYRLARGQRLAVLSRRVEWGAPEIRATGAGGWELRELVRKMYPGTRFIGQMGGGAEGDWGTIVVAR